jgi:hypothetical protein
MLRRLLLAATLLAGVGGLAHAEPAETKPSIATTPLSDAEKNGLAPILNHVGENGNHVHLWPTTAGQEARMRYGLAGNSASSNALSYHGGAIMNPKVSGSTQNYLQIYTIYWMPASGTLQNGATTGFAGNYQQVNNLLGQLLPTNHLMNVATQYYQSNSATTFVNQGYLAGTTVYTANYPASGCTDSATPGACVSDAQVQSAIGAAMTAAGWTPGPNKIFLMYTSSGEGSCISGSTCAYTYYCAYHSSFTATINGTKGSVIYGNEPYGNPSTCQASGQSTPNAVVNGVNYGPYADLAANVASHEVMEMVTDPFGNAWFDRSGNEIGDKCGWNFGTNTYSVPVANQYWSSNPGPDPMFPTGFAGTWFELQQEYSNAANTAGQSGCVQYYPKF